MAQKNHYLSQRQQRARADIALPLNNLVLIENLARLATGWTTDGEEFEYCNVKSEPASEKIEGSFSSKVRSFLRLRTH
jgi:hypothetical protein